MKRVSKNHGFISMGSFSILAGLITIGGCASTQSVPEPRTPVADPLDSRTYPRVIVSPDLDGLIVAGDVVQDSEPNSGAMVVTLPIRSTYQGTLLVQYRAFFLGTMGEELNPDTPWRDMVLENGARRVIRAQSLGNNPTDWRLEIRGFRR